MVVPGQLDWLTGFQWSSRLAQEGRCAPSNPFCVQSMAARPYRCRARKSAVTVVTTPSQTTSLFPPFQEGPFSIA